MPSELKCSVAVLVPKVTHPIKAEELRPKNLFPVLKKLLKIMVHEQLSTYLTENDIIYEGQSGFRSKHSCENPSQYMILTWKKEID